MARSKKRNGDLLAKGGGNATSGGVSMQASVAASIAVQALIGNSLDTRLGLGAAKPISVLAESEIPVDDIAIETDAKGWVFIQSKNKLSGGATSLTSEFGKTCDEIARLWMLTSSGDGTRGWNRPLQHSQDAIVIAIGPTSSGTYKTHLQQALNAVRAASITTLNEEAEKARKAFETLLGKAFAAHGTPAGLNVNEVMKFVHVLVFDFGGTDRGLAETRIATILEEPDTASAAFNVVEKRCQEPRWLPDFLSPSQLRLEFLVRARIAGNECKDKLPDGPLRSLLLGKEPNQLESITSVPSAYAAGPLEGGVASSQDFPADLLAELRKPTDEKVLEAKIFASVVNFSLTFRFDTEIAGHIADLLRKVQYRLALTQGDDISFTLIMGLAAIAASARHTGLADEIRILTRVLIRRGDLTADAESQMRIAMVTCASREKRDEWCKAVGDWLLEIANGKLARKEAARLRSDIHAFCHAVPDLWPHIAKVDAALALVSE